MKTYKELKKKVVGHETTLAEAQAMVIASRAKGVICPCCGQDCRVDPVRFNCQVALCLSWMVRRFEHNGGRWFNPQEEVPRRILRSRKWPKLAHWGLAEMQEDHKTGGKVRGSWRPTEDGIAVAHRQKSVPTTVYTFDRHVLGFSLNRVYIDDGLGPYFDINEILRAEIPMDILIKRGEQMEKAAKKAKAAEKNKRRC